MLALLVAIVIIGTPISRAASTDLGDDDMVRLKRGEILLQTMHGEKPGGAARVSALFQSNTVAIWDVIGYCKYALIYMKGLKLCETLGGDQFHLTVHHRLRNSWYSPMLDYTFKADRQPDGDGKASLNSGNLSVLEGQWEFHRLEDGKSVIVVHEIRIRPKFLVPRWLVRRSLRSDLPDMLACIRGLAEASGDKKHINIDLNRCPGDISIVSK